MKFLTSSRPGAGFLLLWTLVLSVGVNASATELKQGRVTQVVNDVKLLPNQATPRPAAVNDTLHSGTALRTGIDSRSELTFTDQTLARLGANTLFSFEQGTRNLELQDGAMLLRVPKDAGGAKIRTAAVTAAITGTTVMMEFHPGKVVADANPQNSRNKKPAQHVGGFLKFISLEGTARLYLPGRMGESVLVKAGQMLIVNADATSLPDPVDVDIHTIMQTSLLIVGFPPLGSQNLIAFEQQKQTDRMAQGGLYQTNLAIFGGGVGVSMTDPTNTNIISIANPSRSSSGGSPTPTPTPPPTPTPTPNPSKFGALQTITSPNPYQINNTTTIVTEPTITTNGVAAQGKIYRGPAQDGSPSQYFFGGPANLNFESVFESSISGSSFLPLATFKFQSLQLAGVPAITITGGPNKLALIAIDGITSAGPGGNWNFPGLAALLLATQNGSITIGSEISFQNLPVLALFARGNNSDLIFSAGISGDGETILAAQRNVNVDGTSIDSQTLQVIAGQNINIGVNSPVTITGDEASFLIPNSGAGNISGDASITLQPAGGLTLNGSNGLSLTIDNTNGGHIGRSATLLLSSADLTVGSLNMLINNRNGGSIGSSAQVLCNITGAFAVTGDASIGSSNRNDGLGGGTMGADAIVNIQANSFSVGGLFQAFVSANAGGRIGGNGIIRLNIAGDINAAGGLLIENQSTGFNVVGGPFIAPGLTVGDALVDVSAANLSSNNFISSDVMSSSGRINGNAGLAYNITGAMTAPDVEFFVGGPAGHIGGDATLQINSASISGSTQAALFQIGNANAGFIGGNAALGIAVSGAITSPDVEFAIGNRAGQIGQNASMVVNAGSISASATGPYFQILNPNAGTIGGSATMDVTAGSISGNSLFAAILNSVNDGTPNGTISSNATINFNLSGTSTIATDATFQINGSDSAASSAININGGIYNVAGTFTGFMDGNGTFTLNNATIAADTIRVGVFGPNGILRVGGGSISANTLLHLYAPGSSGLVDFVSNVTLSNSGGAVAIAGNTVTIENGVVVTIAGNTPANVYANVPNYTGSGGNGTTRGTFGGAGATTQPLSGAPVFVAARRSPALQTKTAGSSSKKPALLVANSSQLRSLLRGASTDADGKVRITNAAATRNLPSQPSTTQTTTPAKERRNSSEAKPNSLLVTARSQ